MPEMGSARDELLVEARHLTVENGGLSRPATLQIVETSIASSGVRGGRMSGSHPASIFVPIVSSPFSSPSAHSRGVSLYLRVSVDRTAVARHSEDPSIGGGKSWKRAEVFSVLGLSDQAIHDAHGHRGLLADRHGLGAAASRPEPWMPRSSLFSSSSPRRRFSSGIARRRSCRHTCRPSMSMVTPSKRLRPRVRGERANTNRLRSGSGLIPPRSSGL